ncbi:hypothetical protein SMB93_004168 [Cronobacter sakazakii]|uniref:hypothetical protein n=1 Tax=Enterobacter cloacae complex TaxID=354276 RepID=UPI001BD0FA00|nr:hypothetical protein [Enterobacter asburiae]ELY2473752.1 hypothetical protein [Cronobacter sakazakii]HBI6868040.1 hypothetical protein [Enterobacter cancerogenus]HCT7576802.1 hypothetical protein [Enterobacter cloacae]EHN8757767.1 hypothetical protein [Enterobacter asburiae]EHN8761402.1 hypothetical protein [Enterobacter asburiae]
MNNKTMDTVNTLINSFHDNWHLPTLQLVNAAWRDRTPEALLEAVQNTEQAITALEHLQTSVARLVQRDCSTITPEEAWRVANEFEELACSLQYITAELGELSLDIAKVYGMIQCE